MTKEQAKERAAARKLVAGQGTLDRFLSPAHGKPIQKQLAKAAKHRSKESKDRQDLEGFRQDSHSTVPSRGQKRGRPKTLNPEAAPQDAGQAEGCLKRPRRQMVPLRNRLMCMF